MIVYDRFARVESKDFSLIAHCLDKASISKEC